jgi:hypothetical protein
VGLVRVRDDDEVEVGCARDRLLGAGDDLGLRVRFLRLAAPLGVGGGDDRDPEAGGRGDERAVEDPAREAVAEDCGA